MVVASKIRKEPMDAFYLNIGRNGGVVNIKSKSAHSAVRTTERMPTQRSTLPKKTGVLPYAPTEYVQGEDARTTIGKGAAWRRPYNGQTGMYVLRKDRHVASCPQGWTLRASRITGEHGDSPLLFCTGGTPIPPQRRNFQETG